MIPLETIGHYGYPNLTWVVGIPGAVFDASQGQKATVLFEVVPRQYISAKAMNPDSKVAITTGGGNDVNLDKTVVGDGLASGGRYGQRLIYVINCLLENFGAN